MISKEGVSVLKRGGLTVTFEIIKVAETIN